MRKIAVINQKGGVGKTTSCCNVGAAIASTGRRVLMVDLDPQAHLSMHLGVDPYPDRTSVYNVLTDNLPVSEATIRLNDNLHLIPAHIDLAAAEMELVSVMGREVLLRDALPEVAEQYDVMMMDCPPSLGVLTINGLAAADEVLIPLQPHFLALQGVGKLLETIELVQKRINPELVVSGIILCMYEAGTRLAAEVTADLKDFVESARESRKPWSNAKVFDTFIRRNIKLAESPGYGKTIFDYAQSSNGAIDYTMLAAEVLGIDQVEVPKKILEASASCETTEQAARESEVPPLEIEGRVVTGPEDLESAEEIVDSSQTDEPSGAHQSESNHSSQDLRQSESRPRRIGPNGGRIPIQFEEATDSDSVGSDSGSRIG